MSKAQSASRPSANGENTETSTNPSRTGKMPGAAGPKSDSAPASEPSKSDRILRLLRRKKGASISDLQEATGWQAHSLRGFLSGTVKKRMGLPLQSEQSGKGGRRYLIVEA